MEHIRHWTVFRLGHMGDVALTTGVLARLGERLDLRFTVVCKQAFAELFTGHPFVSRCIGLDAGQLEAKAFLMFCLSLAAEQKGQGLLDLHGTPRSRLLGLCWRGPVRRYDKAGLERRLFLASGKRLFREKLRAVNVAQRYYTAMDSPPPPQADLVPRIWLSDEEKNAARKRLDALFTPQARPVALHPYATHAHKAWPGEHWLRLAELLDAAQLPWFCLGRGTPLFPERANDLTNTGSLRESCALLSHSAVLVTGDSGPMHLAPAVGTPAIAMFGPTAREWGFYPAGPRDVVLERDLPCRPCSLHGKGDCPDAGRCLSEISPEEVFAALARSIGQAGTDAQAGGKVRP